MENECNKKYNFANQRPEAIRMTTSFMIVK